MEENNNTGSFGLKQIIAIAVAVVIIVLALIIIFTAGNNYKTPIKVMQKYANKETFKITDYINDTLNGLGKKEIAEIFKLLSKSDDLADSLEDLDDMLADAYEGKQDIYGDHFKVKYKIEDKDALSNKELKAYKSTIKELVASLEDFIDMTDDYDEDDWDDMADESGLSVKECKALVKAMEGLAKEFKSPKITKGYCLEVNYSIKGEDDDDDDDIELDVIKLNGRWVCIDTDALMSSPFGSALYYMLF